MCRNKKGFFFGERKKYFCIMVKLLLLGKITGRMPHAQLQELVP
jgi:hypothetical protein